MSSTPDPTDTPTAPTPDCTCSQPNRPDGNPEGPAPWECLDCGGFACEYADRGQTRCPSWRCDCFIEQFPDSPMDLHPEAFSVSTPSVPPPEHICAADDCMAEATVLSPLDDDYFCGEHDPNAVTLHRPFTDDGVTYCGWDKNEGCGEVWPCSAQRDGEASA